MRSNVVAQLLRGATALTLGLSLILGSLILGSVGAGPSASAEGPASVFSGGVFYGYVFTDVEGTLPDHVRALGAGGAVCGSADVMRLSDTAGFYVLSVVSSELKRGCPASNGVVQFSLRSGRLDDGAWAEQVATLDPGESVQMLNLRAAGASMPNWAGAPGNVDGGSLLRWTGEPASLSDALAALPFATGTTHYLDPARGIFVGVSSPTGLLLTAGDLLLVRFP